jgi:hypothetical protein
MQRRIVPRKLEPDQDVINVEKSIEAAEEITGNKLPGPEEEKKAESLAHKYKRHQKLMQMRSDPIHGSLGPPPVKMEDLTPEQ